MMNGKEKIIPLEDEKLGSVTGGYPGEIINTVFTVAGFESGTTVSCSSCGRKFKLYTDEDVGVFQDHETRCRALTI